MDFNHSWCRDSVCKVRFVKNPLEWETKIVPKIYVAWIVFSYSCDIWGQNLNFHQISTDSDGAEWRSTWKMIFLEYCEQKPMKVLASVQCKPPEDDYSIQLEIGIYRGVLSGMLNQVYLMPFLGRSHLAAGSFPRFKRLGRRDSISFWLMSRLAPMARGCFWSW